MKVPFLDLKREYGDLAEREVQAMRSVMERGDFILGSAVSEFEREFSEFSGAAGCAGVASGTDAIELALRAVGIGAGDGVIIPANTFVGTAIGALRCGAVPQLTDVRDDDFLLDLNSIDRARTASTRAVCAVHLYGKVGDMKQLADYCRAHSLDLIEDCAQAHGARGSGTGVGLFGRAGCFSFYPAKNLGCCGDGGAVISRDPEVVERIRALRNYGSERKYEYPVLGFNSRLDTVQAAILSVRLLTLAARNRRRREIARSYSERLAALAPRCIAPKCDEPEQHVFHLYVVRIPGGNRDRVRAALAERGIDTGLHYPVPFHLQRGYEFLGYRAGSLPVTERLCGEILSLPLFAAMREEEISAVADAVSDSIRALG